LDFSTQAAVLNGLAVDAAAITQQTPFSCPSGNYRWDEYFSVTMCSTCLDVSNQITTGRAEDRSLLAESQSNENNALASEVATSHHLPNSLEFDKQG
jgi:hypothetical protein